MTFKPKKAYGGWVGLIIGILIFGFILWGIHYALDDSDRTLKLLLTVPTYIFMIAYLYLVLGAFNLSYKIDEDALHIIWGWHRKRIPWDNIEEVIEVKGRPNLIPFLAVSWRGYTLGLFSARGIGAVRMYATHTDNGFLYLKTSKGFYGITPEDHTLIAVVIDKTGKPLQLIDMDAMSSEKKGECLHEDRFYRMYYKLNIIFLAILAIYLGIFFPGSGAPKFIILLPVLALVLFIFNASNAKRLYQFSSQGAYFTLLLGLAVSGIFIILSFAKVGFGL
ncbi:MAG: PH domain-containing protein [Syntrophomonadaceae bacterium]|nr:PH domain-containing protein [Syntrophomonadaceae bacterium]